MPRSETSGPTHPPIFEAVIRALIDAVPGAAEGRVMTQQAQRPYRRIDCDNRALAFVRYLTRSQVVRIDVSGLWVVERDAEIRVRTGTGSATLLVDDARRIPEAVAYVADAVARTRAAYERERRRREVSHAA